MGCIMEEQLLVAVRNVIERAKTKSPPYMHDGNECVIIYMSDFKRLKQLYKTYSLGVDVDEELVSEKQNNKTHEHDIDEDFNLNDIFV